ncbi:synaptic vesicle glycoprotein 2B-like isoform X2 [Sitophilus oryzae]|uniref:Synaptic vesicle glycoprotein 2B-like isoform X2 n=1 Tax=Sitophilus oryzae TaxID=7048 RepID=A0A6J2YAH5_SITOR|nr:synaptic vesicle glycoprotein 2B-like isoform X2 [Sitophilus oryzae]
MCEESACLVPPLDQVSNNRSAPTGSVPSGEALVGFHEDALSQAAMGKAQVVLSIVLGLALASECSELSMLNFILPAAELHLCIEEHKKEWLVSITLLAMACGSLIWGILGDYIGRRRALLLALTVTSLFSAVASVMPTYGTFMTARFCSGLGIAGAFPLVFSYMAEACSRSSRSRYIGVMHSMWPVGAVFTAILFHVTMPTLGADIVRDNKEHWSSWHRFLMLSILPAVGCLVGLMWASESPRYLLEASREVEALAVYQRFHKLNQSKTQYGLTELELPGRSAYRDRPSSPTRNIVSQGLYSFREAFQKITSPIHFRTTVLLATLHFLIGLIYMGMSTFSSTLIKELREREYLGQKKFVEGQNFTGNFTDTIENVYFKDCRFDNVSFTHVNLIHVNFWNCTVEYSEFINVKTSVLTFENSFIRNSRFIDTDLTDHHFVKCNLTNNSFLSLISNCVIDFDYNIYLDDLYDETLAWSGFMIPGLFLFGFLLDFTTRSRIIVILLLLASQVGGEILFIHFLGYSTIIFTAVEIIVKVLLVCALCAISLVVVEAYPCHLRCTAHGIMRSLYHIASLCAIPIYTALAHTALLFPAVVTVALTFTAAFLSLKIQDNSKVLL